MPVRIVASLLAMGGILWGAFCLLLVLAPYGFPGPAVLAFAPGYLVTVGYLVRACSFPPLAVRYLIWGLSFLVQGGWLLWALVGVAEGHWFTGSGFESVTLAWWAFAFFASAYGALAERNTSSADF
jgi:hypothetical protein